MKKIPKILTLFALFITAGFPAFAITDEQIENYFYKKERSFYFSATLDWEEITFHYDESSMRYEWVDHDEACDLEMDSGNFSIKNGKVYLESKHGKPHEATVEGIEDGIPNIDYYVLLNVEGRGIYKGAAPEAGEKVCYKGVQLIKTNYSIITDKVYVTYTAPDENSDFHISNRIYMDRYKDVCGYRIMPGIGLRVRGEYGNWLLVKDNFDTDYAWIHVDNAKKLKHYDMEFSQIELQEGYQDLFDKNKGFLTPLTSEEMESIGNRKGYILYYDYSCVFNGEQYTKKMDGLNDGRLKTLNDNLRLRSSSDLNSKVIVTLKKGSTVKIVELGNWDVIDNIYSKWVKVEVQKGAKDRDGKEIEAGTVGWCYGGYLEENQKNEKTN